MKLDNVEDLELYFSVEFELLGKIVQDELIPNGSNIRVTNKNLHEYIKKRLNNSLFRIEHIQHKDKIFIHEIKSGLFSVNSNYLIFLRLFLQV